MSNRKDVPKFKNLINIEGGDSQFLGTDDVVIATVCKDTKEVLVMSNRHSNIVGIAKRTTRSEQKKEFNCPEAIILYNPITEDEHLVDQIRNLHPRPCKFTNSRGRFS